MAKIMLVEDDNNLREIYEARLLAEGYEIVSAKDGEEALAMAVKEKPDLIISDVMMPKISGFDMLDILRSTPETKNTKVIMMTALSQAEDKTRADKLGADRYLVKSQVTLEDVAKVARDVLNNEAAPVAPGAAAPIIATPDTTAAPAATPAATSPDPASTPIPVSDPAAPADTTPPPAVQPPAEPPVATTPTVEPTESEGTMPPKSEPQQDNPGAAPTGGIKDMTQTTSEEEAAVEKQIDSFANAPAETETAAAPVIEKPAEESAAPSAPEMPQATPEDTAVPAQDAGVKAAQLAETVNTIMSSSATTSESPSHAKKVIQPVGDPTAKPDLNELLRKEQASEAEGTPGAVIPPPAATGATGDEQKTDDPNSIAL